MIDPENNNKLAVKGGRVVKNPDLELVDERAISETQTSNLVFLQNLKRAVAPYSQAVYDEVSVRVRRGEDERVVPWSSLRRVGDTYKEDRSSIEYKIDFYKDNGVSLLSDIWVIRKRLDRTDPYFLLRGSFRYNSLSNLCFMVDNHFHSNFGTGEASYLLRSCGINERLLWGFSNDTEKNHNLMNGEVVIGLDKINFGYRFKGRVQTIARSLNGFTNDYRKFTVQVVYKYKEEDALFREDVYKDTYTRLEMEGKLGELDLQLQVYLDFVKSSLKLLPVEVVSFGQ